MDNSKCQLQSGMQFERTVPLALPYRYNTGIRRAQPTSELLLQHYTKITRKPLNCSTLSALNPSFDTRLCKSPHDKSERTVFLTLCNGVPHWVWLEVVSSFTQIPVLPGQRCLGHCTVGKSNPSICVFKWIKDFKQFHTSLNLRKLIQTKSQSFRLNTLLTVQIRNPSVTLLVQWLWYLLKIINAISSADRWQPELPSTDWFVITKIMTPPSGETQLNLMDIALLDGWCSGKYHFPSSSSLGQGQTRR